MSVVSATIMASCDPDSTPFASISDFFVCSSSSIFFTVSKYHEM